VPLLPVILLSSAALSVALAVYVGRFRRAPGSTTFVLLLLAIATWCAAGAAHWAASSLDAKLAFARLQYFGIATAAPLTLLFACRFTGVAWPRNTTDGAILWTIPALTIVAALTNHWHGALWRSITLTGRGLAVYEHGWWFWVGAAHAYLLLLLATVVVARALRRSPRPYRAQFVVLLTGAILPWAGNLAYISGVIPVDGLDTTPLMFTASGVLFAFALGRNRLFDLVPVARDQLVDSLTDAVIVLDASRRVLDLNAAAERLTHPAWFARHVEDLFPFLDDATISLESPIDSHVILEAPDSASRYLDVSITTVRSADNRPAAWVVLLRDVSEQRRATLEREALERRVQEQQKRESLSVLAGGLAHDFNNLLAGIIGNADLLAMQIPRSSELTSNVGAILLGAQRAADLVSKMLAYAGERHGASEDVDLDALVREMLDLLEASVARHCTLRYHGIPVHVFADPVQMRQVVMNLIINAAEAVDEETGTVVVSVGAESLSADDLATMEHGDAAPPGDYAFVEVRDNGPGIDEVTLRHIFTPFYTTKPAGHGLGLAAVHGIVRGHRGALRVDTVVGRGTCFRVWLPQVAGGVRDSARRAVSSARRTV